MKATTKSQFRQVLVWLSWYMVLLALVWSGTPADLSLQAVVACPPAQVPLFPWQPRWRWRKWALLRYQAWQQRWRRARRAYRRAVWVGRLARLALTGLLPFAAVVDWLTKRQLRRQLGALPVLYTVLEILKVRHIVNRHCPQGRAEIDHGTVALVLILNRLTAPRGLYQIADWLAETALPAALGIPAHKFNDDRLGRTLEALAPHLRDIWLEVVQQALLHFDIDLRFIFYDLTAFVVHGEYQGSQLADFGFAHNTPMGKRKLKLGLNTTADGHFPLDYALWPGRSSDVATVQENLERLSKLLSRQSYPTSEVLLVGDRANLNSKLALLYDRQQQESGLSYLAGLEPHKKEHKALLSAYPDEYFLRHPLDQEGYYGLPVALTFKQGQQQVTHRGLVVLSRPMQRAQRRGRGQQLQQLAQELAEVAGKIGQARYRSARAVQSRANTRLRNSPVGQLMQAWVIEEAGQLELRWQVDAEALRQACRRDGRYLLVTNHPTLSPSQMLAHYRRKDDCEKNFTVCKKDLRVSPLYLHKDERIEAMLLLHMLALLAYNVLQRQARQHGLPLTTRRIIAALENLTLIETHCWDGSVLVRLTPLSVEQAQLLQALAQVLEKMRWPHLPTLLPSGPPDPWGVRGLAPGPTSGVENLLLPAAS